MAYPYRGRALCGYCAISETQCMLSARDSSLADNVLSPYEEMALCLEASSF